MRTYTACRKQPEGVEPGARWSCVLAGYFLAKESLWSATVEGPFSVLVFICAAAVRSLSDMSDKDAGLTS